MFTSIRLKNYKSLIDVNMDLTKKNKPKNIAVLYGENGSGKSNLASVFFTLSDTLRTMLANEYFQKAMEKNNFSEMDELDKERLFDILSNNLKDTTRIIKECKTIDSEEDMSLEFEFELKDIIGSYFIKMDDYGITSEKLYYLIDKKRGYYFELEKGKEISLNSKIFMNQNYYLEIKEKIEKYWGKHSLLCILCNEDEISNSEYLKKRLSPNLMLVIDLFKNLTCQLRIGDRGKRSMIGVSHKIFFELDRGTIEEKDHNELKAIERFLNEIFTNLYVDIKKVYYEIKKDSGKLKYRLFCNKLIGGKLIKIDFEIESTGTIKLLSLIPDLYEAVNGRTVIIDEFDSGIHDLLIKKLLLSVNKYIKGQLILTTHNTLLMESGLENDSLYFIVVDEYGNKEIKCLADYDKRTHPNNNIRSLYLKGVYEGIPIPNELDFDELKAILGDD